MNITLNATSKSIDVEVYDDAGLPVDDMFAADFPVVYWRLAAVGGASSYNVLTLTDLLSLNDPYTVGGLIFITKGKYRLDMPNGAWVTKGEVTVWGDASGKHLMTKTIQVGLESDVATATASDVAAALAAQGSVVVNRPVIAGTVELYVNADYTIARDRSVTVTVPAGSWPNLDDYDDIYLGVTKEIDNSGGFTLAATSWTGSDTLAQPIYFEPRRASETNSIDANYAYRAEVLGVVSGTPDIYEPIMKLAVQVNANRVTVPVTP